MMMTTDKYHAWHDDDKHSDQRGDCWVRDQYETIVCRTGHVDFGGYETAQQIAKALNIMNAIKQVS